MEVDEHLAKWEKEDGPKTLELLVEEALDAIRNTAKESMKDPKERVITETAKKLLSILHSILIEPIQDQLRDRCTNLVISHPHGFISQIPFQTLYDETRGDFLILQKTLCVVPSIRALHRCFQRQAQERWEDLKPPLDSDSPWKLGRVGQQ